MYSRRVLWIGCLIGISWVSSAFGQLPGNQTIQWRLRADAGDATSKVDFHAIVTLIATEIDGDDVGWSVESVEFFEPIGAAVKTWIERYPVLDTPDGLWWVNHVDSANPSLNEFVTSPVLRGRAFADDPDDKDLYYELESASPSAPGPFSQNSEVTYAIATDPFGPPVKTGDDEMVETDDTRDMT